MKPNQTPAPRSPSGPNTDELRHDIDSGQTGEKIRGSDPAAAPLGADEEAAGAPPSPGDVGLARARETSMSADSQERNRGVGAAWLLIGFIVVLAAVLIGWILLGSPR